MLLTPIQIKRFYPACLAIAAGLVVLAFLMALAFGAVNIPFSELTAWLLGQSESPSQIILESLRLPRALLAGAVGAVLAICGAVAQGLFRNPLADPSLIGVSAGASAGASLVIVFVNFSAWGWWGLSLVSVGAFTGAVIVVLCVYTLATSARGTSVVTMLLAGIAFSYLAASLSTALEFVADNHKLRQISLWKMGGLESADGMQASIMGLVLLAVTWLALFYARALDVLLLGESEARHLGFNVRRVKCHLIVLIAAGVGVSVALAGTIAFVGLIVPHIVRMLVGPNHQRLLPLCALFGAALLMFADVLARVVIAPTEVPVGLITAVLGAPLFIALLVQRRKKGGL